MIQIWRTASVVGLAMVTGCSVQTDADGEAVAADTDASPASPSDGSAGPTGASPAPLPAAPGAPAAGVPMGAPGSAPPPATSPAGPSLPPAGGVDDGGVGTSDTDSSGPSAGSGGGTNQGPARAGVLTAGAWDDNRNFDFFSVYRSSQERTLTALPPFGADRHREAFELFRAAARPRRTLDVAFVIDTTGSMSDEIAYLQAEFISLSDSIADAHPQAEQRWSLVVYRDEGDSYVVRSFDFVDDRAEFQAVLAEQGADGGGDFPEAPDQALAATAELDWRGDEDTARLAFWVADAPHHPQNAQAMVSAVDDLAEAGVHVYPVASSGVDELTELSMRSVAQLTGGRYLFLTDDSGVGDSHKEPTLPCYFVTKLDDAILRMVDIELSGEYREPAEIEIVRTGGQPQNGRCELDSGDVVMVY